MRQLTSGDEWTIVQEGFDPEANRVYESLFSLGNGNFGGRGTHEEYYSGDSLPGNYLAGIYYPDPTRVGWWKNGYPEYFAKVLNAADWTPIDVVVDGERLDLASAVIDSYERRLHMRTAELERTFRATLTNGSRVQVSARRFLSMSRPDLGVIRYRIVVEAGSSIELSIGIDGDVTNEDSNYDAGFWDPVETAMWDRRGHVVLRTKKTGFVAGTAIDAVVTLNGEPITSPSTDIVDERSVATQVGIAVRPGDTIEIVKLGANVSSRTVDDVDIVGRCHQVLDDAVATGFDGLLAEHRAAWEHKWDISDVVIGGDLAAQQGLRFSMFQLQCTFTGVDPDLNIGPKGFTGEKYGGVTYWDTEAFCLRFYLAAAEASVSKNLLRYRYRQLGRAIENAAKLGFSGGAALYPMVTINGEECHNEWEITFEEIHRNGAIAFAVYDYLRSTGDRGYLLEGGLEVLVAIARFWAQRASFSELKQQYVILGVTGPNEYENNVDNNWYTNLMAQWTLRYANEAIDLARETDGAETDRLLSSIDFDESTERDQWKQIAEGLHFPEDADRGIFLQQGNYLDKELRTVDDLDPAERPIVHHWSWDRILRSCFIKQADVLQGLWVFEDRFDLDTLRVNFDFYEPRTVHESSLSPSVHAVLAVRLGRLAKAHEMLLRSARLDLDDVNADTRDGCHVTSMAGTWIAAVQGFGGHRVVDERLHVSPVLAPGWSTLAFQVHFRGTWLAIRADAGQVVVEHRDGPEVELLVHGSEVRVGPAVPVAVASQPTVHDRGTREREHLQRQSGI